MYNIRRMIPEEALLFHQFRLQGLLESPLAFAYNYEEEKDLPLDKMQSRMVDQPGRGVLGAFLNDKLVGVVVVGRERLQCFNHKAVIWGLYVVPKVRGQGIARALLQKSLELAQSDTTIRQVNLWVNATNASAIHLYQSLEFAIYGYEPDSMLINGQLYDELHMRLAFVTSN